MTPEQERAKLDATLRAERDWALKNERPAKQRPTDEEFAELARKRDEALEATVRAICDKEGWPREKVGAHFSHVGKCYCACPDGPCQHIWDGKTVEFDNCVSVTCSRCGVDSFSHDMRFAP